MTWIKVPTTFFTDPRILRVGPDAGWLHLRATAYASDQLTDGRIDVAVLPTFGLRRAKALAQALVAVGYWEETDDGWQIVAYLDLQTSADEVRLIQKKARDRQAAKRAQSHDASSEVRANIPGSAEEVSPLEVETEVETEVEVEKSTTGAIDRAPRRTFVPKDYTASPKQVAWAKRTLGMDDEEIEDQTDQFIDFHLAKGSAFTDWNPCWETFMKRWPAIKARSSL